MFNNFRSTSINNSSSITTISHSQFNTYQQNTNKTKPLSRRQTSSFHVIRRFNVLYCRKWENIQGSVKTFSREKYCTPWALGYSYLIKFSSTAVFHNHTFVLRHHCAIENNLCYLIILVFSLENMNNISLNSLHTILLCKMVEFCFIIR